MKPSPWKRWLSYLYPVPIRHVASARHPSLHLELVRGRLQLSATRAIYSHEDLYHNFAETFRHTDLQRIQGRAVLVLGLGLGSVIQLLEQEHAFGGRYTAVEHDDTIADWAEEWILRDLDSPVDILRKDAVQYVQQTTRQFDLILLDLFEDDCIPAWFSTAASAKKLHELLLPGGLLICNRLYRSTRDKIETDQYLREAFAPSFPQAAWLDVDHNRMLLSEGSFLRAR